MYVIAEAADGDDEAVGAVRVGPLPMMVGGQPSALDPGLVMVMPLQTWRAEKKASFRESVE